jgi:hypothetical protein
MTVQELEAMAGRLLGDILLSISALQEIEDDVEDAEILRAVAQEGLTLAYRCTLLSGIKKLLAGRADELTRTERGLLGRNARIKPLLPDDDGGEE